MAATYQSQPFYRQGPLTLDTSATQKLFVEDEMLDESILDHSAIDSGLDMSPPMADSRRPSFNMPSAIFSSKADEWQALPSNNPFIDHSQTNPFARLDAQPADFVQQQPAWTAMSSGACTPMQRVDSAMTHDFTVQQPLFAAPVPLQTPFSNPAGQVAIFGGLTTAGLSATAPKDSRDAKALGLSKSSSPNIRMYNELRRGDGIRKKNARFEIPPERTLSTIDHLIAQSTDEMEIKELKQQKRLLRNRQAALDSRQRKKQHTERLEDEKKQYTATIGDLEEEVVGLREQAAHWDAQQRELHAYIARLELEKEEMVRHHTLETADLRKKVNVLTSHVNRLEAAGAGAQGPVSGTVSYNDGLGELQSLSIDAPWDMGQFIADYPLMETPAVKEEALATTPAPKKTDAPLVMDLEKQSSNGGLIFMLFLVGAWVLSSRSTPSLPSVSEDVRVASASLLNSVMKDAGVPAADPTSMVVAPRPSGASWSTHAVPHMTVSGMDGMVSSDMVDLADSLTRPTEEQANEQVFSLSAAQYNGLNEQDFIHSGDNSEREAGPGRRNLAEALAAMRNKPSTAEVYTRSLLWDQIPTEVVREFAKMVAESNGGNDRDALNDAQT